MQGRVPKGKGPPFRGRSFGSPSRLSRGPGMLVVVILVIVGGLTISRCSQNGKKPFEDTQPLQRRTSVERQGGGIADRAVTSLKSVFSGNAFRRNSIPGTKDGKVTSREIIFMRETSSRVSESYYKDMETVRGRNP